MNRLVSKSVYYISSLGTSSVYVIDGEDLSLIDKIKVGQRPCDINKDNKNNLYIAMDRDEKIFIINHLSKTNKTIKVANNGCFKVDSLLKKIYISNIEELLVYSLDNLNIIEKLKGFSAIDCIQINKDGRKIFILDIIENEIKIYDLITFKLIKTYRDICISPKYMILSEDDKNLYISDVNIRNGRYNSSIIKLNLYTNNTLNIELKVGSKISYLEEYLGYIYVVNKGLYRIDIIDGLKNKIVGSVKPTFKYPENIKIDKNNKKILIISRDDNEKSALDLVDLENNKIEKTFYFNEKNIKPYDIEIIEEELYIDKEIINNNFNIKSNNEKEISILAKKIISTYNEKVIFQQEMLEIQLEDEIIIDDIDFDRCIINNESKMKDKEKYIVFSFDFYIPYYVRCRNFKNEKLIFKGNLSGKQKAALLFSDNSELNELEFNVKANNMITSTPYIRDSSIVFDVVSIITTYLTKEEVVHLPSEKGGSL